MSFAYEWRLADGYERPRNGRKVLSTFACGGGSTMGYKLAGFDVVGCCEIDPQMMRIYRKNHSPRLTFEEDIRTFRKRDDLPSELFDLDVLDGSPPCSAFSTAGNREEDWGKAKHFREGQAAQRLDDLFFEFVALAERLRPRVVVAENVKGMLIGKAKGFVKEIVRAFELAGYQCQVFLLNSASMGVPQARERSFFLARRRDLGLPGISLGFGDPPVTYGQIRRPGETGYKEPTAGDLVVWRNWKRGDRGYDDVNLRIVGKPSNFNSSFVYDHRPCPTIVSAVGSKLVSAEELRFLSLRELLCAGTFPQDYDFLDADPKYVLGMSVPPVMTARVAEQIEAQWLARLA